MLNTRGSGLNGIVTLGILVKRLSHFKCINFMDMATATGVIHLSTDMVVLYNLVLPLTYPRMYLNLSYRVFFIDQNLVVISKTRIVRTLDT